VSEFTAKAPDVWANGYPLIPIVPDSKVPGWRDGATEEKLREWSKYCVEIPSEEIVSAWAAHDAGLGIPCGNFVVVIDIDIVEPALALEAEQRSLAILGVSEAPVRTGRFPKRAIFCRPSGVVISKSRRWVSAHGQRHGIEILASSPEGRGSQVVAYGRHPDTAKLYVWRGGEPATTHRDALPEITQEMADAIIALVDEFSGATDAGTSPAGALPLAAPGKPVAMRGGSITEEGIKWVVENLPNASATTWDDWLRTGFAIYEATRPNTELGWQAWRYWSSKSPIFDERYTAKKWLEIERDSRGTVGIGSLVKAVTGAGLNIPAHVQLSDTSGVNLSSYVDRMADLEVGQSGLTPREYCIYLYHLFSGSDDFHERGILGIFEDRCPGEPIADDVTAEEIERVRQLVVQQIGELGEEDPRELDVMFRSETSTATMKVAMLAHIDADAPRESDNVVTAHGLSVRMSPRALPVPPAITRYKVPGVVCEFARWVEDTGPAIVPEFGVTAGLALVSTIVGRAVKTATGIRPNIYVLNLARSGTGKNHAISRVRKTLAATNLLQRHSFGSMAFSGSAIRNSFHRASGDAGAPDTCDGSSMSKLWTSDEFGAVWAANSSASNAHGGALMGDLLSFFSGSDEIMAGTALADRSAPSLPWPHLSILGTSTPAAMFEAMTVEQMRAGHANRFLIMEPSEIKLRPFADKLAKWTGTAAHLAPPDSVIATVSALARWCREREGFGSAMWTDYAHVVPMDTGAIRMMAEIEELKEACNMLASRDSGLVAEPFTRLDEVTGRVALLSAMSRLSEKLTKDAEGWKVISSPEIILADVQFAFEMVKYSAERVAHAVNRSAPDSDAASIERVLTVVRRSGADGISKAELLRGTRIPTGKLGIILDTLNESREIVGIMVPTKSKKKMIYFTTSNAKHAIESDKIDPALETTW
jgi:hypothetical protein